MLFPRAKKSTAGEGAGEIRVLDGFSAIREAAALAGADFVADASALSRALSGERMAMCGPDATLQAPDFPNIPVVVHQVTENGAAAEPRPFGNHCFQLIAATVQEALDFSLIARRVSELALLPAVVSMDGQFVARAVQTVRLPEPGRVEEFLGAPGDRIAPPTPAQKLLFGEQRRRLPRWLNLDRPLGLGAVLHPETQHQALAARQVFFQGHLLPLLEEAFRIFGELTGRFYRRVRECNGSAEYLLIAQGPVVNELAAIAATHSTGSRTLRPGPGVGVLGISLRHPFPGDLLSHLMRGKKGVTILEAHRPGTAGAPTAPGGEDPPLLRRVRACLDKAVENGRVAGALPVLPIPTALRSGAAKTPLPYPDHAVYAKPGDRPPLFSGIFAAGGEKPRPALLQAAMANMLPGGAGKRFFYLDVPFLQPGTRFPLQESLQQQIRNAYPRIEELTPGSGDRPVPPPAPDEKRAPSPGAHCIQLRGLNRDILQETGALLAQLMAAAGRHPVHAFPETDPAGVHRFTVAGAKAPGSGSGVNPGFPTAGPEAADVLIVENPMELHGLRFLRDSGFIIIDSPLAPPDLWEHLGEKWRNQIREHGHRLFVVDATAIARESAAIPAMTGRLCWHALLGAMVATGAEPDKGTFPGRYESWLQQAFDDKPVLADEMRTAFQAGKTAVAAVEWAHFPEFADAPMPEPEAPLPVCRVSRPDGTVFDPGRFWDCVGYFYATPGARSLPAAQIDQPLADPFLATATVPARSGAFRNLSPFRSQVPQLLSENCSGCGMCWFRCPETALPATVLDMTALVKTMLETAQQQGHALIQIQRIATQLARLAERMFNRDDLHQYRTLGSLLSAAFEQLLEKLNLPEEQRAALVDEFARLQAVAPDFPIVKTTALDHRPEATPANRSNGKILSIAVNPAGCTACGACVAVCPEDALEMVPQTTDLLETYRRNWQFLNTLPEISPETLAAFIDEKRPETLVNQLLHRETYHTLEGGDTAFPGSGAKTAVHLLTARAAALWQPRMRQFREKLDDLLNRLEAKMHGQLEPALRINDFEAFGQALSRLERGEMTVTELAAAITGEAAPKIDQNHLRQLHAAITEVKKLRDLLDKGFTGYGRAKMALVFSGPHLSVWAAGYPFNPFAGPWIRTDTDIAAVATGVFQGITRQMAATFAVVRRAELVLQEEYQPARHEKLLNALQYADFTAEERALCPPVLVILENESTTQSGKTPGLPESCLRLLAGQLPVKIAVLNDSAGMTPQDRDISGEFALHALIQGNRFVAQTTAGVPEHFLKALREGLDFSGPALFHIYAAEPLRHGLPTDQAAHQERLAVRTRTFPLFIFDPRHPGSFADRLSLHGNPQMEADWAVDVSTDGGEPSEILTPAHWAANEGRFRAEFHPLPAGDPEDRQTPLPDYFTLSPEEQALCVPCITLKNRKNRVIRVAISQRMAAAVAGRLAVWRLLQELAGTRAAVNREIVEQIQAAAQAEAERRVRESEANFAQKMSTLEQQHWQIYHQRLTTRLLKLYTAGRDPSAVGKTLQAYLRKNEETNK